VVVSEAKPAQASRPGAACVKNLLPESLGSDFWVMVGLAWLGLDWIGSDRIGLNWIASGTAASEEAHRIALH